MQLADVKIADVEIAVRVQEMKDPRRIYLPLLDYCQVTIRVSFSCFDYFSCGKLLRIRISNSQVVSAYLWIGLLLALLGTWYEQPNHYTTIVIYFYLEQIAHVVQHVFCFLHFNIVRLKHLKSNLLRVKCKWWYSTSFKTKDGRDQSFNVIGINDFSNDAQLDRDSVMMLFVRCWSNPSFVLGGRVRPHEIVEKKSWKPNIWNAAAERDTAHRHQVFTSDTVTLIPEESRGETRVSQARSIFPSRRIHSLKINAVQI